MDVFNCLTVRARPGESETDFAARLCRFWTHMLRSRPDKFAKVYAETTKFETGEGRLTRQYLVADDAVEAVTQEMAAAGVEHAPVDRYDVYTKYEATPPHWMQIEH